MSTSTPVLPRPYTRPAPTYTSTPIRGDSKRPSGSPDVPPLVLVVDDHDDSRVIERLVLESVGFRVIEARAGLEGLRLASDYRPAAVLLDMVLPELDGWEIARLLRANDDTRGTSIIAVTAVATHDEQHRAIIAGCNEVLTKPVSPTTLLRTVQRYVGFPTSLVRRRC